MAQKDDKGKWGKPQAIDSELNSNFDEGACCFSPDGRTMFLTQCKTDANYPRYATIVVSQRNDAAWSKPTELIISKDTLTSFAHPAISPDGEWLYFVSDMLGGLGGYDIWRCRLFGNNEVGMMENLGERVNTPGDEMFPTFRPNGDLYFSSNGHPGMGGLDIYILSKGGKLSHPGSPLNSQGDDSSVQTAATRVATTTSTVSITRRSCRLSRAGSMSKTATNCLLPRSIW